MDKRREFSVEDDAAVRLSNLRVEFDLPDKSKVKAVDGVDLVVAQGEVVGVAGESGSGKTTLLRAVAGLEPAQSGTIEVNGQDVTALRGRSRFTQRKGVQMIFQDPLGSLNPRRRVADLVLEPVETGRMLGRGERRQAASDALSLVGLNPALLSRYPADLSGGQRQLVSIARALTAEPTLLLCDEPVSALDVSVQARLLRTLKDLAETLGLAVLIVSHDLTVINYLCDSTYIMYGGTIVAAGPTKSILTGARHPYTAALVASLPNLDPNTPGMIPLLVDEAEEDRESLGGCTLASRCWLRDRLNNPEICTQERPDLVEIGTRRLAACHFPEQAEEFAETWSADE